MERTKYLQWTLSPEDATLSPLGYIVQFSEDSFFSLIPVTENTFDTTFSTSIAVDFEYDTSGTGNSFINFPVTGLVSPPLGTLIRYQVRPSKLLSNLVVIEGQTIHRINSYGREVFDSVEYGSISPGFITSDANDNVWVTDSSGRAYILNLPLSGGNISSVTGPSNAIGYIPDSVRGTFWRIGTNQIALCSMGGQVLYQSSITAISSIVAHWLSPNTGTVFVCTNNSIIKATILGSMVQTSGVFTDISSWSLGTNGTVQDIALLVNGSNNTVYQYNANNTITSFITASGVTTALSVSANKDGSIYVLDGTTNILNKYTTSGSPVWNILLPIHPSSNGRISAIFKQLGFGPVIYYWSANIVGAIYDRGSSGIIAGHFGCVLGPNAPALGHVLNGTRCAHAWTTTSSTTGFALVEASSSSSSSSSFGSSYTSGSSISS